ncbi:glutaminase A [Stieleria sp. TO1_6]|uniref:glutaminase A n=1 Tax=Stieleria tagensis TaxID=2956795 RepID=UPI00209B1C3E|nr:glutaminase A [Stieleria tagensis]MCO8124471.1 glutaminase A [Stieleria tagensis]
MSSVTNHLQFIRSSFGCVLAVTLSCFAAAQPAVSQQVIAPPANTAIAPADQAAQVITAALQAAHTEFAALDEGKNADYIPALAAVDPKLFGIALVTVDGKVFQIGDCDALFAIESISKVFTLAQVLQESGEQIVEDNIGVDATGQVFNSIVAIEQDHGFQQNPFVNAGAITTSGMVLGSSDNEKWTKILNRHNLFAGRTLSVNEPVFKSEAATNQRNQAIAELMAAYGHIKDDPKMVTTVYTRQCSINVNAKDLATMAATLANGGLNPVTGVVALDAHHVPKVLAVMATAGLYDDSGIWLYNVGLPAKSGVGGGIIAVAPGKYGIAAFSPPLDAAGNSVRSQKAIEKIADRLGGNPYRVTPQ